MIPSISPIPWGRWSESLGSRTTSRRIDEDRAYGEIMADAQWRNSGAINAGMTGYQVWEKGL